MNIIIFHFVFALTRLISLHCKYPMSITCIRIVKVAIAYDC